MRSNHQVTNNLIITSGLFRGRRLIAPKTIAIHPMGSREKLALFNSLKSLSQSPAVVLDLYCGSGALGLEALSRGAKTAVFVDQNSTAIRAVRQNIAALGLEDRSRVLQAKISASVPGLEPQLFDLIFVDPPYTDFPVDADFSFLSSYLSETGILVLSHPTSVNPAALIPNLCLLITKTYAAANLSFFAKPKSAH